MGPGAFREPYRAAVVGGGLAGVAAATVLAERGARVTLFERDAVLGGRASAWTDTLAQGDAFEMERGFHAFFRQYYNLRALLRRIDPELELLTPLADYPILSSDGEAHSFSDLARRPPFNVIDLTRKTPTLTLRDLVRVKVRPALAMLAFDPETTYERYDHTTAAEYLDSLQFPPRARRMLFDVFAHSFFNPEQEMSAAELLMMFHFYFMGNPEGLVFDVARQPFSTAIWRPLARYLEERDVVLHLDTAVRRVEPTGSGFAVEAAGQRLEVDGAVLATAVPALQAIVEASPALGPADWRRRIAGLSVTNPFAVWRLWLDRPMRPDRAAFAGTTAVGCLDNISLYHLFEDESRQWAERTGGSVVELHAYALPEGQFEAETKRQLLDGLHAVYPESVDAVILEDRYLVRHDCPAFRPGSHRERPGVDTGVRGLAIAGDFVKLPLPSALMERAVTSGMLAANRLMEPYGISPEPIASVPRRGMLATLGAYV